MNAAVVSIVVTGPRSGYDNRDVADRLVAAAATLSGELTLPDDEQLDWGAALRAELVGITVPAERRRFTVGARPRTARQATAAQVVVRRGSVWRSLPVRACQLANPEVVT